MRKIYTLGIFSMLYFGYAPSLYAQRDSISKEVIVVKEYNPTIHDAFKINTMPGMPDKPQVNKQFEYQVSGNSYQPPLTITPLQSESFKEPSRYSAYQNHITGGFGNYSSFMGDVFYHAYKSNVHQLDFYGTHFSTFGNIKLEDGTKSYAPFIKNKIGMAYIKRFKQSELRTDIFFKHRTTRYYGYETVNDSAMYTYQNSAPISGSELKTSDRQRFTDLNLMLSLASLPTRRPEFKHHSTLNAYTFGDFATNRESSFALHTELSNPIGENYWGAEVGLGYLNYNTPTDVLPHRNIPKNNIFSVQLTPFYLMERDTWKLKIGANAFGVSEQTEAFKFLPTPEVNFEVDLIEDIFSLFVNASGKYEVIGYKALSELNPFIAPNMKAIATQTPLDLMGGFRAALYNGLDIHLAAGYAMFKNRHFFVNEVFYNQDAKVNEYTNMFTREVDDGSVFKLEGELIYQGTERLDIGAMVKYQKFSMDSLPEAWHVPQFKLSLYGKYKVNDQITAQLLYQVQSAMQARMEDGSAKILKSIHDVSLKGEYKYNERITGFLHLNNILAQKYYLWNGYPSQGFNAMLGATFMF